MAEERIKILHVLDSLAVGGMERVVIDVVNGLNGGRFSHAVCCVSRLGEAARQVREDVPRYDMGKGAESDLFMASVRHRIQQHIDANRVAGY